VRFSKKADPSDFWKTYFTSSKEVKKRIQLFGKESFQFEIRKIFDCPVKARKWEDKVLRRINIFKRNDFINKSYGVPYVSRSTNKGKKMMFFIKEESYRYVDESLVSFLVESGVALLKGKPKPILFGKNLSDIMKGKPKSKTHKENMSKSQKGKSRGTNLEFYGEERAKEIAKKSQESLIKFYENNVNYRKGKTYEEIHGIEKAVALKKQKSDYLQENNPSIKNKGKTYEEIHGIEKALELKKQRSIIGRNNSKIYSVYSSDKLMFTGDRESASKFISEFFQLPISNILYRKSILELNHISIRTLKEHH
jgi:hypothetical protein